MKNWDWARVVAPVMSIVGLLVVVLAIKVHDEWILEQDLLKMPAGQLEDGPPPIRVNTGEDGPYFEELPRGSVVPQRTYEELPAPGDDKPWWDENYPGRFKAPVYRTPGLLEGQENDVLPTRPVPQENDVPERPWRPMPALPDDDRSIV